MMPHNTTRKLYIIELNSDFIRNKITNIITEGIMSPEKISSVISILSIILSVI
jgi:hypothetical protein